MFVNYFISISIHKRFRQCHNLCLCEKEVTGNVVFFFSFWVLFISTTPFTNDWGRQRKVKEKTLFYKVPYFIFSNSIHISMTEKERLFTAWHTMKEYHHYTITKRDFFLLRDFLLHTTKYRSTLTSKKTHISIFKFKIKITITTLGNKFFFYTQTKAKGHILQIGTLRLDETCTFILLKQISFNIND
jgi:hypothetical protein